MHGKGVRGDSGPRRLPIAKLVFALLITGVLMLPASPVAADAPDIHVVEVEPGDGIEIVFVGAPLGASSWWGPPAPEQYVQDAMADIVEFFEQHSGVTAAPIVVVFRDIHIGQADATPPGLIRMSLGTGTTPQEFRRVLAHEYYHVLQFDAAGGSLGWPGTPRWMIEGAAKRSELVFHDLPAGERRDYLIKGAMGSGELCGDGDSYAVGALAIDWLTEQSGMDPLQFYRSIGPAPQWGTDAFTSMGTRWEEAFEATYGTTPTSFCAEFEAFRTGAERAVVASFTPHIEDGATEPVIEVVGSPPRFTARALRAEVEALHEYWLDRFGAGADYTVRITDVDASQDIRGLPTGYAGNRYYSTCLSSAEVAGLVVLNATCDWWSDPNGSLSVLRAFHRDMTIAHLTRNIPSATYRLPYWFDRGVAAYTGDHYNRANGGYTRNRADAVRSLRRIGPLVESGTESFDDLSNAGFLAVEWLVERAGEHSIADFYRALGNAARDPKDTPDPLAIELANGVNWQAAFESAFGLTLEEFYTEFERYRERL